MSFGKAYTGMLIRVEAISHRVESRNDAAPLRTADSKSSTVASNMLLDARITDRSALRCVGSKSRRSTTNSLAVDR
jgi:hypothetical protein